MLLALRYSYDGSGDLVKRGSDSNVSTLLMSSKSDKRRLLLPVRLSLGIGLIVRPLMFLLILVLVVSAGGGNYSRGGVGFSTVKRRYFLVTD